MHTPTLRQLRTFLAVVETGSVSTAAQALHLTQPAASQQLRELERALAVRLLDRAGGRMLATAAGTALIEPARRIQGAIEEMQAVAQAHRAGDSGRVRLGTGATACIYLLPRVLEAAHASMPGLEVTVATGNSGEIATRVAAGTLDLGLVTLPVPPNRALTTTRILADELLAVIPSSLAPGGDSIGAASLSRLPLILYEPAGSTRAIIDAWFRRGGKLPQPAMQLDSIEAIKVLVGSGLGASIMPRLALAKPVPGAVLRHLRPALTRQLGVVLRREKRMDPGLRTMLAALRTLAASSPTRAQRPYKNDTA